MRKAVIFGVSQFSELLTYYLTAEKQVEISAYTVESAYLPAQNTFQSPVVPFEEVEKRYPPEEYGMFLCVGYNQMNTVRERIYAQAKEKGYEILSYVHPTATVLSEPLGEGTIIFERVLIGPFVKMGVGNVFWAGAHVAHHTEIGNFNFFTISVAVAGNIHIGNNCFFGNNCTIRNNITIADHTLVGAGCYVTQSTGRYSVHVPVRSVELKGKCSLDMRLIADRP